MELLEVMQTRCDNAAEEVVRGKLEEMVLQVELQVGPMHQTSNVTLAEHGAARWDEMFLEARAGLPSDIAQCPDVFVNINFINADTKVRR